jgi:protein-disulfide isomerase
MIETMFSTRENWAVPGVDAKDKLFQIAERFGISKEQFDQCLTDKSLFNKIVETRQVAHDKFHVDATPTFFVNGKRMRGDHQIKDFEVALGGAD